MALAEQHLSFLGIAALEYAAKGWAVAPLHSALQLATGDEDNARCTCGDPKCKSPGKHPRTEHGIKEASAEETRVRRWWTTWSGASIALACGTLSGCWVLDVDAKLPKHNEGEQVLSGLVALELLEQEHGPLPETLTSATGGGGKHLFFRLPEGRRIKNKVAIKGPGGQKSSLDVRSTGGYVVLPPSPHASGVSYAWATRPDHVLVDAPLWLLDLVDPPTPDLAHAPIVEPASDGTRERNYVLAMLRKAGERILGAGEGARHETMFSEAVIIGGYVAGGHLTMAEARGPLEAAGIAAGKSAKEVRRTITDGLTTGQDTVRHPPPPTYPTARTGRELGPPPDDDAPPPSDEDLGIAGRVKPAAARPGAPEETGTVDLDHARRRNRILKQLHRMADRFDRETGEQKLGLPKPTLENAIRILREDPLFAGRLAYNLFSAETLFDDRAITDADLIRIRYEIDRLYRCGLRHDMADHAITHVARDREFDPLRDYLEGLQWDGVPRLERIFSTYFGSEESEMNAIYGIKFFVSAIARALVPGEKADLVLTLKGDQYAGKSRACRFLAVNEEWFTDQYIDIRSKDGAFALEGRWVIELAELSAISKSDVESVKGFLSRQIDKVRRPWDRKLATIPRRCVFVATTNADRFLRDPTGARRFCVVACGNIDLDGLKRDRDQLWAEAITAFRQGVQWRLTYDEIELQKKANEAFETQDPWFDPVREFLSTALTPMEGGWTSADIMIKALKLDGRVMDHAATIRLGHVLRTLGYERFKKRIGTNLVWMYRKLAASEVPF